MTMLLRKEVAYFSNLQIA